MRDQRDVTDEPCECGEPNCDECYFARWAKEMVQVEVSRGMLDKMWERIKVKLDDLKKVEQLLAEMFGESAEMVDEDSIIQPEQEK